MPLLNIIGNEMNSARDGSTNQNTLDESALTFSTLFVSTYSQMIARTDINGMEATIAPNRELLLAVSEISTTRKVVTMIFKK